MTRYDQMETAELKVLAAELADKVAEYKAMGLDLNMARGKPSPAQLDLSLPLLDAVSSTDAAFAAQDGSDVRNYGVLAGIPEARVLMGSLVGAPPEQVIIGGSSSLNMMYDAIARAWAFGIAGNAPWSQQERVCFLCPSPGYDRHFGICEIFGIEMKPVPMTADGPDMDMVRIHVESDAHVKGIWCVPQYSNPQGYTYSDACVEAFAALEPAAPDFRIFWDNAYVVHHLYDGEQDHVADILQVCDAAGHPDMVFEFCSTSKMTFPGAGISAFVSSKANVDEALRAMGAQTIGNDKINQLRHVRFLKDADGVAAHMSRHAELLRPKFEAVLSIFEEDFAGTGVGTWTKPKGGYFISFLGNPGTAKATVAMAASCGVKLTKAGATWPYGQDPDDADIRIAPSFPTLDELKLAARVFTACARLVAVEALLKKS